MPYSLGWSVVPRTLITRERWPGGYKTRCTALVRPGQDVLPDQPIIRLEKVEPIEDRATMPYVPVPTVLNSPTAADYRLMNGGNGPGKQRINETLPAGLRGRVVEITRRGGVVIESVAAVVQGVLGVGNQVAGVLTMWQTSDTNDTYQTIPPGALLVIPGPLNFAMLRQAMISEVAGVIASSISSRDLEGFLRTDLVQLFNSIDVDLAQLHLSQMTLLLTEGLGTLAMPARTLSLLSQYQGSIALLSGATSVRQGIFPELVISLPEKETQQKSVPVQPDLRLIVGAPVRVSSGKYEGATGTITYLFGHQLVFDSGVRARAARLRMEDGSMLVLPITLLERIG